MSSLTLAPAVNYSVREPFGGVGRIVEISFILLLVHYKGLLGPLEVVDRSKRVSRKSLVYIGLVGST